MPKNLTPEIRRKIQTSTEGTMATAKKFNVMPSTVKKWRDRDNTQTLIRGSEDSRQRFIQDLEVLFEGALADGNYFAALRAKELLAKEEGFLKTTKIVTQFIDPSLETLSSENMRKLAEFLQDQRTASQKGNRP